MLVVGVAGLIGTTAAVHAIPEPTPGKLPIGKWSAVGVAQGEASAVLPQGRLELIARFQFDFRLIVDSDLAVTGDWVSNGAANLYLDGTDGVLEQSYLGDGIAFTIGDEVVFDGTYDWTSTFISQGLAFEVPAGELIPKVTLIVEGSTCEEAWGQVAVRWEDEYEGVGWTPSFAGNWNGVAQDVPDSRSDFLPGLNQLIADHNEQMAPFRAGQPSQVDVASVWGLIQRSIPLINEIRNLGECAEKFFGPENLEHWTSVLSSVVSNSIIGIAMFQQPPITGQELLGLVDAGLAAGAFSSGQYATENAALAERLLQERAQEIFDEAWVPEGAPVEDGNTCQAQSGCIYANYEQAAAVLSGRLMGWDFALPDGSTISAAEIGQYWTDAGIDVDGTVRGIEAG